MKERLEQLRAKVSQLEGKLESRTKKIILISAAGVILLFAIILALFLNREKEYEVLFSNLNTEEAQQIIAKLQESGTDYQYTNSGQILVPVNVLDLTRANLALEGYPKNGFAYQTFIDNAGLMTTDADKNRYALYDLQDRMGATIELFSGVKSAEVTIALGETKKYALSDSKEISTAHAVVTMLDGGSPTMAQAQAVQRLVASGVPGLEMENVSVFDGNGNDVTVSPEEDTNTMTSSDADEIAQLVEGQISEKVLHVLIPFFGEENVLVSVKAEINMETLIRETIIYNTPEKIDQNDKTGILSNDSGTVEISGTKDAVASGVAGSETNADVPEYNTGDDADGVEGYGARSWNREFLVNQIKEQGQVSPGALEDLTISVALNSAGFGDLTVNDIRSLVGNAAGIPDTEWVSKISVVSGAFYQSWPQEEEEEPSQSTWLVITSNPLFWIILGIVLFLLILAVVLLIISSKRKKRKAAEEAAAAEAAAAEAAKEQFNFDQEMIDFQNDRGMELKQSIREFTEENPEIAAQMLKTWLNGGKMDGE